METCRTLVYQVCIYWIIIRISGSIRCFCTPKASEFRIQISSRSWPGLLSLRNQCANLHWWYRTEVLFKFCMWVNRKLPAKSTLWREFFFIDNLFILHLRFCILTSWKSESAEIADVDPAQVVPNQTSSRTSNHHGNQPKSSANFTIQFRGFVNKQNNNHETLTNYITSLNTEALITSLWLSSSSLIIPWVDSLFQVPLSG